MTNVGVTSWGAPSPQGPGWWQASDGLWYPPQQPVVQVQAQGYEVQRGLEPGESRLSYERPAEKVSRLRPFYVGLLMIPAFFTFLGVAIVAAFSTYAAFFGTLLMGRVHPRSHDNIVRAYRYQWRLTTFALCWRTDRPQPGQPGAIDAGDDPAQLSVAYGGEGLSRLGPIIKPFLAIPKMIGLFFKMIGGLFTIFFGQLAVVFTGEFPQAGRDKIVRLYGEITELNAYLVLSDRKPR